jgi:hypothetical protein
MINIITIYKGKSKKFFMVKSSPLAAGGGHDGLPFA